MTDIGVLTTKTACGAFGPITWSRKDTPATVEQIKEHNAAGEVTCPAWKRP